MSILIYCCGPLHPKAMNGVCVGRKKQSLYQTRFSSGQAWKPGEGWEFRDNSNHLQSGILYQIKLWGTLNQNLGKFAQVKCDYFCNNLMSIFFITLLVIGTVDREKYAAFLWILLRGNVSKEVNEFLLIWLWFLPAENLLFHLMMALTKGLWGCAFSRFSCWQQEAE